MAVGSPEELGSIPPSGQHMQAGRGQELPVQAAGPSSRKAGPPCRAEMTAEAGPSKEAAGPSRVEAVAAGSPARCPPPTCLPSRPLPGSHQPQLNRPGGSVHRQQPP